MTIPFLRQVATILAALAISTFFQGCKSNDFADVVPGDDFTSLEPLPAEDTPSHNPNKDLPMDFSVASETARDSKTFPGGFRIAADSIEIGRAASGPIPNIGAQGEAYLEMPHPDGTPLHIRGNRIRSHGGTVTVSGWPVVVRQGQRLVGTTKETVIKIGSDGVQALGPSSVEDLVSSSLATSSDFLTPLPSLSASDPFIPLPPDLDLPSGVPSVDIPAETPQRRGIVDGKPLNRTQKRGFSGAFGGTDNPALPGAPAPQKSGIDLSPAAVSTDLGIGNLPPLPSLPPQ